MHQFNIKYTFLFIFSVFSVGAFALTDDYEAALKSFSQKDIDSAYIHVRNALQEKPDNLAAKILMADILIELKSYHVAQVELMSAIEQGADLNLLIDSLGKSLIFQGKFSQALNVVSNNDLDRQGKLAFAFIKATAYRGLKDLDNAKLEYIKVLTLSANNIDAFIGLVSVSLNANDIDAAQKYLNKAEKIDSENADVWRLKGLVEKDLNNTEQAIVYLNRSNDLEPQNIKTLRILANIHSGLGHSEIADGYLDQVLAISPNNPQAQLSKSTVLKALKKDALAEQILDKLSNQLSNVDEDYMLSQPELMLIDSMTSYAQGNWNKASEKFQRYLSQESDNDKQDIAVIVLLADVYLKIDAAKKALTLLSIHETRLIQTKSYGVILAGLYLQFNQHLKADYVLNKLNELYPADPSILILQAKLLKELDRPQDALILLEKTNVPTDVNFQFTLAIITFDLELFNQSLEYIESTIQLEPENTEYQLFRTRILFRVNRANEAVKLITELYETKPNDKHIRASYALLKASQGDYDIAKVILSDLVIKYPSEGLNFLALADIENKMGNVEEAVSILKKLVKKADFRIKASLKLTELYYQSELYQAGMLELNTVLKLDRFNENALVLKIRGHIALEQKQEAINKLRLLKGLWQGKPSKLLLLSRLQQKIQEYVEAETILSSALKLSPQAMPILLDSIKLKIRLRKLDEATALITQAANITSPNDLRLLILKGDIKKVSGDVEGAFSLYFSALKQDDSNAVTLIKLSQISHSKTLSKLFISYLETLVNQNPGRTFERKILADNLMLQKNYPRAKYHYQMVLTKNIPVEQRGYTLNNLAMIEIYANNLDSAISYSEQALKDLGPIPVALDTHAWALVLSGNYDEGLPMLRRAYSMSSSSTEIQYHIAYTLAKLNRKQDAINMLNILLELPNDFAQKSVVETLLLELESSVDS